MPKMVCDGWWEQEGFGRQAMRELVIEFESGRFRGVGNDIVGAFEFSGRLVDDQIFMQKQYVGRHRIDYEGATQGEGVYGGQWRSDGVTGGRWSIRFRTLADDQIGEIQSIG